MRSFHVSPRLVRKSARGVSDLVATILMIAIVVVLAAVLLVLVKGYTSSTSTAPNLGGALVLATPTQSTGESPLVPACAATPCNFYNMTVQSASPGMELHDLAFEIQVPNGTTYGPTGGIVALNGTGAVVGAYGWASGWTSGETIAVNDRLTIVLYTSGATPLSLSGDNLRIVGVSGYTGSVSVHIV